MQTHQRFSWRKRFKSFQYAYYGVRRLLQTEHNTRIHTVATVLVIACSFLFRIAPGEWALVLLATGFVWTAEIWNTCIEKTVDIVQPEKDERVRFIKDMSAAAVLVAAIVSFAVGLIIFLPKIIEYVSSII